VRESSVMNFNTSTGMRLLVALSALCLAVSCVGRPVQLDVHPTPTPEAVQAAAEQEAALQAEIDAMYARIDEHAALYREGIDLIVAGQEVPGEERIVSATNRLQSDAERCSQLTGCSTHRYFGAFDGLLTEQGIALKQQALRVQELVATAEQDVEREPGTSPFAAEIPELGRTTSLLRGTDLAEIITLNGPVKAAINDWLTWMRPMLMGAYHNYQFLRHEMAPVYEEAGLPEALLFAMIATETGGKVHSFSRAGAAGPLQFMRSTGRRYGLGVVDGFDMRLDPESSTRANVGYLNDRFEELNDSLELALAAYNGGESRMMRLHRRHGSNLWDGKLYYSLPRETREYVPRVLAAAWLYLHAEDYALEFPVADFATTTLALQSEIAIDELSICLGQQGNPHGWFRTLRNLNPRLSPGDRLKAGETIEFPAALVTAYEERCLDGELVVRAHGLHEANYPPEPATIHYTVRRGDTLGRIASNFRCASVGEIADLNRVRAPRYVIREGQLLKIPTCK